MGRITRQNSLTNDEKTKQINPGNIRLQEDFLNYMASVQRSPKTIKGYANDLLIFFTYVEKFLDNKDFAKLTKRDYTSFQNWLINENGNSPARVRRIKTAISSLSNYIVNILDDEEEYVNFQSTIRKIENPAMQAVRTKTVWQDEELDALLRTLTEKKEYEIACMVAMAMCNGRRKAELCRFRVRDFTPETLVCGGALYKTAEPIQTKGFGMGKYLYCYTLAKKFQPYLDMWLKEREIIGIESEWLFPNKTDEHLQLGETTLNSWANRLSELSGKDFYWHALRHYFTTYLAKSGLPDNVVQQLIGWESADMVAVYKDISAEDQISQYFDENGNIRTDVTKTLSEIK